MHNLNNKNKKGFTLLELAIVIAIIGILSAVIIPNFSKIVSSSELRADKQLVDQLNVALEDASNMYGTPESVEQAMLVLEQSGYSSALEIQSEGVSAYWYKIGNAIVLVKDGEIIYPSEYSKIESTVAELAETEVLQEYKTNDGYTEKFAYLDYHLQLTLSVDDNGNKKYSANYVDAEGHTINSITSSALANKNEGFTVPGENDTSQTYAAKSAGEEIKVVRAESVAEGQTYTQLTDIIETQLITKFTDSNNYTSDDLIVVAAGKQTKSSDGGSYALVQAYCVVRDTSPTYVVATYPVVNGETDTNTINVSPIEACNKANLVYIQVELQEIYPGNTAEEKATKETANAAAKKAAGLYLKQVFEAINNGVLDPSVNIVFSDGAEIDLAGMEWDFAQAKSGYFGSRNPEEPVVISNLQLTSATKAEDTVQFALNNAAYYASGFIGTLYGNATIENVTFKNVQIEEPGADVEARNMASGTNYANVTGIIGAVTNVNCLDSSSAASLSANVTISNVTVDSESSISGTGIAGGLIGYVGSAKAGNSLDGSVIFKDCEIKAAVSSSDYLSGYDYGCVGGFIGKLANFASGTDASDPKLTISFGDSSSSTNYFLGSTSGFRATAGFLGFVDGLLDINFSAKTACTTTENADVPVSKVEINETAVSIAQNNNDNNNTYQLSVYVYPANATNTEVEWISSDNTVVTVSETGLITVVGSKDAKATITVRSKADSTKTATCSVTIKESGDPSVVINNDYVAPQDAEVTKNIVSKANLDRKHSASCVADFAVFNASALATNTATSNNVTTYMVNANSISPYSFSKYLASDNIICLIDSDGKTCGFSSYGPLYSTENGAKAAFESKAYSVIDLVSNENKKLTTISNVSGGNCSADVATSPVDCFYNIVKNSDSSVSINEILAIQVWQ